MLLRFLLDGGEPEIDLQRLDRFVNLLYEDLCRQGRADLGIERNATITDAEFGDVEIPILITSDSGAQLAVAVHSGLTPNFAPTPGLRHLREFSFTPTHLVDETLVRKNLSTATRQILDLVTAG